MNQYFLSIMKGQKRGLLPRLITYFLVPCTLFYRMGVFCHQNFYRLIGVYEAPKPVISIGNITVGGSGKTPLVIMLARYLQDSGLRSNILIRGYMPQALKDSDEVDMLNEQIPLIPVLAGSDRIANIKKSKDADVFIADDAFQHWPLGRDLNIVTIDAGNPFGNGYLLPAGTLREPLSALKRADVFVLTKTGASSDIQSLSSRLGEINPKALMVESRYKATGVAGVFDNDILPEDFLNDKPVVGFCAIGDPLSFEMILKNSGAGVCGFFSYMDHHVYTRGDIHRMLEFCRAQNAGVLVTTHKDAVKLRNFKDLFAGICLVYIPIQLEITKGSDEFFQKVISVCRD
jgi:tetraacyldisaccharide 4'-kinase